MAKIQESFTTPKGTKLPLLNLKGKIYLQVMHRLIWFREDHPTGVIKTQMMESNGEGKERYYIFKAEIFIDTVKGHQLVATGYKRETVGDFPDAMEKSEQGSVGRALNFLGYGTAFAANELDEGTRLADSPAPVVEKVGESGNTAEVKALESMVEAGTRRSSFRKTVSVIPNTASNASDDI